MFFVQVRLVKERDPEAPAIVSPDTINFYELSSRVFEIKTSGYPVPSLSLEGTLPAGLVFTHNFDGTATVSGTPELGTLDDYELTVTASNGVEPDALQVLLLRVNPSAVPPDITSADTTVFESDSPGSFTVTVDGFPEPEISIAGSMPDGLTFVDNQDGTATLSGTPSVGTGGVYIFTIAASNGEGEDDVQEFTLEVYESPVIISDDETEIGSGELTTFTIEATGYPAPSISCSGTLPDGMSFTDNGDGTGTISGPAEFGNADDYELSIEADNGFGTPDTQTFTLTIVDTDPIIPLGSIILWYGLSSSLPDGCEIFASTKNNFVMGCGLDGITLTSLGALDHSHGISVAEASAHNHSASHSAQSSASGSRTTYLQYTNVAGSGHRHSFSGTASVSSEDSHTHTMPATGMASNLPEFKRFYWVKVTNGRLPVGGVIPFYGNLAQIPAGFAHCNGQTVGDFTTPDLRGKFIYGASQNEDVDTSGGASSHDHTVGASSTRANHSHTVSGGSLGGASSSVKAYPLSGGATSVAPSHGHSLDNSTSSSDGGHSHSGNPNTSTDLAEPPYQELHFIVRVSQGSIASGSIVCLDSAVVPSGWHLCDGNNGTPNLVGKFVKGDPADNLGSGGVATHTHENESLSTSLAGAHTHSGSRNTGSSGSTNTLGGTGASASPSNHSHTVSYTLGSGGGHAHGYSETGSASNLPPHIKLCYVMKA